jgi:hypothetical protein
VPTLVYQFLVTSRCHSVSRLTKECGRAPNFSWTSTVAFSYHFLFEALEDGARAPPSARCECAARASSRGHHHCHQQHAFGTVPTLACQRMAVRQLQLLTMLVLLVLLPERSLAPHVPASGISNGIAPWTAQQLQQRVTSAVRSSSTVNVPGGDYIFENSSLHISGASQGFTLRAADPHTPVRLWFDIGWGLVVQNSADVILDGPIELDYTSGAHYQGTIVGPVEPHPLVFDDTTYGADDMLVGACYRRSHIILAQCEHVSTHDTWVHLADGSWTYYAHTNCFVGHGAQTILPEPFSNHLGLRDCQAACDEDSDCEAIVVPAQKGGSGGQDGMNVTVQTDPGFLDPDVFCGRYCHWSESEHEIGATLWQNSTQKFMVRTCTHAHTNAHTAVASAARTCRNSLRLHVVLRKEQN